MLKQDFTVVVGRTETKDHFDGSTESEHTTVVEAANSLDVQLCHFDSLSHLLLFTVGNDGGQTVSWKKPTEARIKITLTQRGK